MKYLLGLPKTHWAGDNFVTVSGVLRHCRTAICKAFVLRLPVGSVLFMMRRFTVLTATSARQFECRNATEAMNSGPPSVVHSSVSAREASEAMVSSKPVCVVVSFYSAMSSWRRSMVGFSRPVGWQEIASTAL